MTIRIKLSEEMEQKFREIAMKKFGYGKGSLTKAAENAILQWIELNKEVETFENPTNELQGLLKNLKSTSIQLQHESSHQFLKR
ncbi:MAG: hypothetical protein EAX96_17785 [Candidatus Lokiarchaeota archaeon]|nr:hypothetical protein [Candidatus Lokiarchaeota archaeon]